MWFWVGMDLEVTWIRSCGQATQTIRSHRSESPKLEVACNSRNIIFWQRFNRTCHQRLSSTSVWTTRTGRMVGARTSSLGQAGREILIGSTLICRFPLNSSFHLLKAKTYVQPGDVGRPDRGAGGSEEPGLHLELLQDLLPGTKLWSKSLIHGQADFKRASFSSPEK